MSPSQPATATRTRPRRVKPGVAGPVPVTVVRHSHARVRVRFQYAGESDKVRYPLGRDTRVEGGISSSGDRHAIIVDKGTCRLYETFATHQRTPTLDL